LLWINVDHQGRAERAPRGEAIKEESVWKSGGISKRVLQMPFKPDTPKWYQLLESGQRSGWRTAARTYPPNWPRYIDFVRRTEENVRHHNPLPGARILCTSHG